MRVSHRLLGVVAVAALLTGCEPKAAKPTAGPAAPAAATAGPPASSGIAAAPMASPGPGPTFPRLTAFTDPIVMTKVNALLAEQEKTDRQAQKDCLSQVKEQKIEGDYAEETRVAYLSPRFLSVAVKSSYSCGGPYPTDGAQSPVTYELTTGTVVDWSKAFKPGFLAAADAPEGAPPSALTKLYRARYPKSADAECRKLVTAESDPLSGPPILWLDAKRGVVVQPDFPHVTAACAEEVVLTADDVAPWLADTGAAADLKANLAKR